MATTNSYPHTLKYAITKTDYVAPGKKLPAFVIDINKCIKCGACIGGCKFKAISRG